MITGTDVKSGYGQRGRKPTTSVLPYLRAKQAEEAKKASNKPVKRVTEEKAGKKVVEENTPHTEETYEEAIHSIMEGR